MNAKCFFIQPTDRMRRELRRYTSGPARTPNACPLYPGEFSYHNASVPLDVIPKQDRSDGPTIPHDDPRWPKACGCGYTFEAKDQWQIFTKTVYRRVDTGEETDLWLAPPGAMWYADWMIHRPDQKWMKGPDGHCLMIRGFYGTDFCPDDRASNCTKPDDDNHKCWVRHGEPPNITIDKNGVTCAAGAGSFFCGQDKWHGFVRNGELVQG